MTIEIWLSDRIKIFREIHGKSFPDFLQKMANRMGFGSVRYDPPSRKQRYMSLIEKEFKKYKRTGNCEHLYNVANYCYLETQAPQNPKFHFKGDVKSVRRHALEN